MKYTIKMKNMDGNETIIKPRMFDRQYWRDIWNYRELFYFLAWRDIKVRYKQTVIGFAWAVIRPFLTMVVFSVIFGQFAKLPSEQGVPYPIMVYTALLPWQFFVGFLSTASNSLIENVSLVSKVYMPRIIIPASKAIVSFVDFILSFIILIGLMVFYRFVPSGRIVFIPLFLFLGFLLAYGLSLLFASLNVKYRDFMQIIPSFISLGLYISPVGFSSNIIPDKWLLLYSLNPMVGVINGFRWAILGGDVNIHISGLVLSIVLTIIIFITGLFYFRYTEKTFADYI